MPSQSVEEYIEAIYRLGGGKGSVSTGDLATHMGVAAPSVTTMLKRLVRDGLVEHTRYHGITLTQNGLDMAAGLIRSHRISERLLTDVVGMSWDEVHEVACKLEHVFTGDLADRVYQALGEPDTCPHGNPMGLEDLQRLTKLAEIAVGQSGVVAKVTDEDPEFLRYLQEQRIRPQVHLKVISRSPSGDVITVEADGVPRSLGADAASKIWVRRTDQEE